jgi:proline dehydrogenase
MSLFDRLVVATLPMVPKIIVGKVASQYIAGESLADAMTAVRRLNQAGFMATVDVLGEFTHDRTEAEHSTEKYLELLEAIVAERVDANISIKLTALGLSIDPIFGRRNVRRVVESAAQQNIFVRMDMEDSPHTSATLQIYDEFRREFSVGVAVQAYLKRTMDDVIGLMAKGSANFRLCKGIYVEPESIAYKSREQVRDNFIALLDRMFEGGAYVGIATHDDVLVVRAEELIRKYNLAPDKYEFQMLLGVRHELRNQILSRGHRIRTYVPFGEAWYGYSTRRLKENPQLAGYVVKSLFKK